MFTQALVTGCADYSFNFSMISIDVLGVMRKYQNIRKIQCGSNKDVKIRIKKIKLNCFCYHKIPKIVGVNVVLGKTLYKWATHWEQLSLKMGWGMCSSQGWSPPTLSLTGGRPQIDLYSLTWPAQSVLNHGAASTRQLSCRGWSTRRAISLPPSPSLGTDGDLLRQFSF